MIIQRATEVGFLWYFYSLKLNTPTVLRVKILIFGLNRINVSKYGLSDSIITDESQNNQNYPTEVEISSFKLKVKKEKNVIYFIKCILAVQLTK